MCVGCFFMEIFFARETKKEYGHTRNREKKREKKEQLVLSFFIERQYYHKNQSIIKIVFCPHRLVVLSDDERDASKHQRRQQRPNFDRERRRRRRRRRVLRCRGRESSNRPNATTMRQTDGAALSCRDVGRCFYRIDEDSRDEQRRAV